MSKATNIQTEETNVLDTQIEANTQGAHGVSNPDLGNIEPINLEDLFPVGGINFEKMWAETPIVVDKITLNPVRENQPQSYTVHLLKKLESKGGKFASNKEERYYHNAAANHEFHVGMRFVGDVYKIFDVVEQPRQVVDTNTGELRTIFHKWIYLKGFAPKPKDNTVQATNTAQPVEPRF